MGGETGVSGARRRAQHQRQPHGLRAGPYAGKSHRPTPLHRGHKERPLRPAPGASAQTGRPTARSRRLPPTLYGKIDRPTRSNSGLIRASAFVKGISPHAAHRAAPAKDATFAPFGLSLRTKPACNAGERRLLSQSAALRSVSSVGCFNAKCGDPAGLMSKDRSEGAHAERGRRP